MRRLRSPTDLHQLSLPHEAPESKERRASRAVLLSRFPRATATKWRTRDKQPATTPSGHRAQSAHARNRLPAAAGPLPVTSRGVANQERGRDCQGVRLSRSLPRSGRRLRRWRSRRQRALPSWAVRRRGRCRCRAFLRWQENSWIREGAAFRKPALGTKRNVLQEPPAMECVTEVTWPAEETCAKGDRRENKPG